MPACDAVVLPGLGSESVVMSTAWNARSYPTQIPVRGISHDTYTNWNLTISLSCATADLLVARLLRTPDGSEFVKGYRHERGDSCEVQFMLHRAARDSDRIHVMFGHLGVDMEAPSVGLDPNAS